RASHIPRYERSQQKTSSGLRRSLRRDPLRVRRRFVHQARAERCEGLQGFCLERERTGLLIGRASRADCNEGGALNFNLEARKMEQGKLLDQVADLMIDARCDHWEASSMSREALIRRALERTDGNICQAAKLIGMHRNNFTRCLSELGIRRLPREIRD